MAPKFNPINETDLAAAIGTRLKDARLKREMSIDALADAAQVARRSYIEWENGRQLPRLDTLIRVANLHGMTLEAIVAGTR